MRKLLRYLLILMPGISFAQSASPGFFQTYFVETILTLALFVCLVILLVLVVTLKAIKALLADKYPEQVQEEAKKPSAVKEWWEAINGLQPVEKESSLTTDHEYDGIKELDNNLPPWWKWMFYATIVFSVFYLANYHLLGTGKTQDEEYIAEMISAEKEVAAYKAQLAASAGDVEVPVTGPEAIAAGKKVYMNFCSACHGNEGQGGIGPNFVDRYWIHGGSMEDIIATVENGVPAKGMISWKNQLSPPEIQQVSAFIYALEGGNPANQKAPQGTLYERVAGDEEASGD